MTRTQLIRSLPQPLRWAAQVVAPTGQHRAHPVAAVLLIGETIPPAGPVRCGVLTEDQLIRLLDDGDAEPLESARCPCCDRETAHARQQDGALRCWTCSTITRAGAA